MRPPHYAGENEEKRAARRASAYASMRPPHYAGENRGRPRTRRAAVLASMRPPHYAGENVLRRSSVNRRDQVLQ